MSKNANILNILNTQQTNKKAFCFDYDGTITKLDPTNPKHSHNDFAKFLQLMVLAGDKDAINLRVYEGINIYDPQKPRSFVSDFAKGYYNLDNRNHDFNNPDAILSCFRKILALGHVLTIVTHNGCPEIIKHGLKTVGFTEEEISQIPIIFGQDLTAQGKNMHLKIVMEKFGISNTQDVTLIDDSSDNILKAAHEFNMQTIWVDQNAGTFASTLEAQLQHAATTDADYDSSDEYSFLNPELAKQYINNSNTTESNTVKSNNFFRTTVYPEGHHKKFQGNIGVAGDTFQDTSEYDSTETTE